MTKLITLLTLPSYSATIALIYKNGAVYRSLARASSLLIKSGKLYSNL